MTFAQSLGKDVEVVAMQVLLKLKQMLLLPLPRPHHVILILLEKHTRNV